MANFLWKYLSKCNEEIKAFEKKQILKKAIINKTFNLKHPLQINHQVTKITIRWLKSNDEINDFLAPLKELDYKKGFLIACKSGFNTKNFCINYDVIICDLSWKVVELHPAMKPNTFLQTFSHAAHIFVLCESSITYYSIEIGDFINACTNLKN